MAIYELIIFAVSLAALVWGADRFVESAVKLAQKFGMSELIIGLTIVAVGTSIPELASSVAAAAKGDSGLIVGNIVGSNIANIALIIGLAATIRKIKTEEKMLIRDGYVMLFAAVALFAASLFGVIPRIISLLFTITYAAYVFFLIETYTKSKDKYHFKSFIPYLLKFQYVFDAKRRLMKSISVGSTPKKGLAKDILWMLFGLAIVIASSKYLVDSAISVAESIGVPSNFIGVTLVAVGTSVPELTVSVVAARKGYGEIAIGNVIGSNIANILLIGGITGMILPISVDKISLWFYMPTMIIVSILLLAFIRTGWVIRRREGIALLAFYAVFIAGLIYLTNFA